MTNFTETRNLIQNNKKNDLKRKATMTRKQRLKKQLSIYFDILTQEGSHVEISCAAMKTAEILYPSMVQDLKSICLFEIIHEENDDFNIFNLYLVHPCDEANNGGCSQICSKRKEKHVCSCEPGFALEKDKTTCKKG